MSNERPRIGITTRHEVETERFYLARHYAEAVEAAGGTPLYLPLIPSPAFAAEVARLVDALLLPGSASDVDPALYEADPHPKLGRVHTLRDQMDWLLLEAAERERLPVLGICYGMQILNVFRGGTLIQDIERQWPGALQHEQGAPLARRSHRVTIVGGSRLDRLNGGRLEAMVNSHHHQGLATLGRDLRATARTNDKLIEAVEEVDAERYVVGVQWHPELGWRDDSLSRALFVDFTRAAAESKTNKINASDNARMIVHSLKQ